MTPSLLLLVVATLASLTAYKREGVSPLSLGMGLWVLVLTVAWIDPLGIAGVSMRAAEIIAAGIIAMVMPLFFPRAKVRVPVITHQAPPAVMTIVLVSAVLAGAVVIGLFAFRSQVASATGAAFGDLTLEEVRRAQTSDARGGGIGALLIAANPVLACLGVYAARQGYRWGWILPIFSFVVAMQSPGRLISISLVIQTIAFYVYVRDPGLNRPHNRGRVVFAGTAGFILAVLVFNYVGDRLGKNAAAISYFAGYGWPQWTLSPVLYFTGGLSALAVALQYGIDPQEQGGSVFALMRVFEAMGVVPESPDTLGAYVPIPIPFNVYTAFGQIWFDFGTLGVMVLSFLLGGLSSFGHRRARNGSIGWAWVSSSCVALMLTLPLTYRLFFLDVALQLLAGLALFAFMARSRSSAHKSL